MLNPKIRLFSVALAGLLVGAGSAPLLWADPPPAAPEYDEPGSDTPPSFGFDIVLQDDNNPGNVVLINAFSGDYVFAHPPQDKAGKAAEGYMEQKGVDPNSAAGQVVKPYVIGTTITDSGDNSRYGYEGAGRTIRVTDPAGHSSYWFNYDAQNNRTRILDTSGGTVRYEYDSPGRLIRSTDPAGNVITFRYETGPQGNRLFATDPAGRTTRFDYDAGGRLTCMVNPTGNTTRFSYDSNGRIVQITQPDGSTKELQKIIEELYEFPKQEGMQTYTTEMLPMPRRQALDVNHGQVLFNRDLGADRFLRTGEDLPIPPTGAEPNLSDAGSPVQSPLGGWIPSLDPLVDTGAAAAGGGPSAGSAGGFPADSSSSSGAGSSDSSGSSSGFGGGPLATH